MSEDKYDKIIDLAKRRGYLWSSFEVYGGIAGFVDYGPLGAILKNNVIETWRKHYIVKEEFYEIDSPTVTPYEVLKASGHVDNFTDPMIECKECLEAFRADHIIEEKVDIDTEGKTLHELDELIKEHEIKCPKCGGEFDKVKEYNLMFVTSIGPGGKRTGYMRPETAQGIFIQFRRISQFFRNKLPFGVAQIGKAYRNEISPRQGVIRLREFTQAEGEYFVHPNIKDCEKFKYVENEVIPLLPAKTQMDENLKPEEKVVQMTLKEAVEKGIIRHETIAYFIAVAKKFLLDIGIDEKKLRFRQHLPNEMAHYAIDCWDAEIYTERFGWIECIGIADRTDYDLKAHMNHSGVDLRVFVEFDEPKEVEVYEVELNYKVVGRIFKKDAKLIEEALKNMENDEMEELVNSLNKDGKYILKVGEKEFEILNDYLKINKVKKKISGEKVLPHVIEPSHGIDRITYCLIEHSFKEEEDRTYLDLKPHVAPIKVGVFPLVNKQGMPEIAKEIKDMLRNNGIIAEYDDSGAIGRRYMRMDEIGTPFCITVDGDTLKDNTVTLRERNSREQKRIKIEEVVDYIKSSLH
ncbi:MAG: glycyl-tRNA synthetase [Methanothermococcus sp.]|jgi:glycyl-tRNA synthetase|uniref:glycine--tRNA ligase n=1 Tax=Methanothermococcus TaxID=155862 RepID=UPI0003814F88|nr:MULTISPECIES: glycine--tRNA ligase [Methanothermococcus]MDK2790221.1 glycyl-tRNA synthetase [Methanothermococcus sp.]MDK2987176.1 glycyl-tRNA synthetase [Methanothermococcus sp.]